MNKLIISAPFGNWINYNGVTSTIGTFTYFHRGNFLTRIWRILSTVRYHNGSWINRLGLPNPGIKTLLNKDISDKILSIHGFNKQDWFNLSKVVDELWPLAIELNLSCPNVTKTSIREGVSAAALMYSSKLVIAKLAPVRWMDFVIPLKDVGVTYFHLCNTIPTSSGGLSGKVLKQYSLWAVEEVKQKYGNEVKIIGGGGITKVQDIDDYLKAGADHVAVGSMLFNPLNWKKLRIFRDYLII